MKRAALSTRQSAPLTANCVRAFSDDGRSKMIQHRTYEKEIRQVAARVCGNHIQKPLSQQSHCLLDKYLKAPRAVQPHQVNWVTDTQKLTDLTREMRYLTLYTDGYMDFRDTQEKVLRSKNKSTQDERATKYLGRMYEEIAKKVAARTKAYEASLGPVEVAPTTGVRYGSKKDVFSADKNVSTERATKFHGQIKLDDYYINPDNKSLDYSNNIVYKDVLGVPRNEEVKTTKHTKPVIGWNASMKDLHKFEKEGAARVPQVLLSDIDDQLRKSKKKQQIAAQGHRYKKIVDS